MDHFVAGYAAARDADLVLCERDGVAYQYDMRQRVEYGAAYLAKIDAYDRDVARRVNDGRCALVLRHLSEGSSLLDVGAGSGEFVAAARSWGIEAQGFDVNEAAVERLRAAGYYADCEPRRFAAVSLWDTIEHMEAPGSLLDAVPLGALLFVSVPIFDDLRTIRGSKHYRPGEHLYYWTASGLVVWMSRWGFDLLERSDHETAAGRESIGAFAFVRKRLQLRWG